MANNVSVGIDPPVSSTISVAIILPRDLPGVDRIPEFSEPLAHMISVALHGSHSSRGSEICAFGGVDASWDCSG